MKTTSSSTPSNEITLDQALADIPKKFRSKIITEYIEIKKRFSEAAYDSEYDTAGLSSGKLVETVLRFIQNELTGSFIPFGKHIPNIPEECRKISGLPEITGNESLRIIIPRALTFLSTLRGKRGIGHVGGDVEANEIDAATIVRLSDWIICELIRIFHGLSLEEAQALVETISARNLPDIWEIAGKKRVLRTDLSAKEEVLLLAYADVRNGVLIEDLFEWVEYCGLSDFKKKVLRPLHEARFIELDRENAAIYLSPLGIQQVESKILTSKIR